MRRGLVAAGLVVGLANGLALAGVAYNRSIVVERVELTEVELPLGYSRVSDVPTSLRFNWVADVRQGAFSEAQLRAAGFDLPSAAVATDEPGPARLPQRAAVAFAIGGSARAEFLRTFATSGLPGAVPPPSELVLIDVGRNLESLRAAHPDPAHFLVLWAAVHVERATGPGGTWTWRGDVLTLEPDAVHVPREWRTPVSAGPYPIRYVVTLCIGRRGEPWIERVARR